MWGGGQEDIAKEVTSELDFEACIGVCQMEYRESLAKDERCESA